ncbi:MAG TPA: YciI family protein [Gaiellales bacterium]|nr:YciI family protein [Gaiellales bacterium]
MKYALLIYPGELTSTSEQLSEEERQSILAQYMALLEEPGVLGAEQLKPPESATTVRVEDGRTLTTDGPFADTKEILGGLYLLEADNLDRALEIAARMPAARLGGAVEVRPLVER